MGDIQFSFEHESLALCDHPTERLANEIKQLLVHLGPDARQMIKASMDQDRSNAEKLSELALRLREEGNFLAANRVMSHSRQICEHSWSLVIPMRRNIKLMAEGLLELQEPAVLSDSGSVREIIGEISEATGEAAKVAALGQKKLGDLVEELSVVHHDYEEKQRKHEAEALARREDGHVGAAGLAAAGLTTGGLIVTATSLTVTGVIPILGGVGIGSVVVLGAVAAWWCDRARRAQALERASEATAKSAAVVAKSHEAICCTENMMQAAHHHEQVWAGIGVSAQAAVNAPLSAATLGRLKWCGEQLTKFVGVIDEYLFCLSKTECLPPNFDIRGVIGSETYTRLQREASQYRKQTAPTSNASLSLGV